MRQSPPRDVAVALIGAARDFQKAFREVWQMPYVVLPVPAERKMSVRFS